MIARSALGWRGPGRATTRRRLDDASQTRVAAMASRSVGRPPISWRYLPAASSDALLVRRRPAVLLTSRYSIRPDRDRRGLRPVFCPDF